MLGVNGERNTLLLWILQAGLLCSVPRSPLLSSLADIAVPYSPLAMNLCFFRAEAGMYRVDAVRPHCILTCSQGTAAALTHAWQPGSILIR